MFKHLNTKLEYDDLIAETSSTGRVYTTPTGTKYPSITTVLSILSEDGIRAWRKRVGEEEANRISTRAANRGTAVHSITERYINNEVDYAEGFMPNIIQNFNDLKPILDERLGNIRAQEVPLYSDHLRLAGRVDCVAEFDGTLSIVDFKTSRKLKKKEWVEDYFLQLVAYSEAHNKMYDTQIKTGRIFICTQNNEYQTFGIDNYDHWVGQWYAKLEEY